MPHYDVFELLYLMYLYYKFQSAIMAK